MKKTIDSFALIALLLAGSVCGQVVLTSGTPSPLATQPVTTPGLQGSFSIQVPENATELEIRVAGLPASIQFAIALRFGQPVTPSPLTTDYPAIVGNNPLVIRPSSTPPLRAGTYFIGIVVAVAPVVGNGTITATVTTAPPPSGGFTDTVLTSGTPGSLTIPAVTNPTLLCCFRIEVPAGATRLEVRVTAPAGIQFAIALRFGQQPIASPLTADYPVIVGTNPLVVTTASSPALRGGSYFIGVAVISNATSRQATITATVTTEQPPRLTTSTTSLRFTATAGTNPAAQSFTVRNSGGGTLNFQITSSESWLSASPAQGSSTGAAVTISASVRVAGLAAGVLNATLRVAGQQGVDPVTINVQLQINAAPPPVTNRLTSVSAASLTAQAAPESIVSSFGQDLAPRVAVAESAVLPESLEGVTVTVTDSAGVERPAKLFFVAPGQINLLLDAATALGEATLRVRRDGRVVAEGTLRVERVAPAIFTANANGRGVAAAQVLRVRPDGSQSLDLVFQCASAGNCIPAPIDPGGEEDQVFLLLYGTGMRGRSSPGAVSATIGGDAVEASDAVAQGQFAGLDQVNLRLLRRLAGRGVVNVVVRVDGRETNTVTVEIGGSAPPAPPPVERPPAVPTGRVYQPVAQGLEWSYRVTFPQMARVPHKPIVEEPAGLLCSNVFCGLQTWNAGQIEFSITAGAMAGEEVWEANITGRGPAFFFPTTGPIQIRRRHFPGGLGGETQLELVNRPVSGLTLVRALSRPGFSALTNGILRGETLTVPAGTFRNVITVETTVTGDSSSGFTGTYRTEVKLAPYVGIIRAVMRDPNGQILFTQELTRFQEPAPMPQPRFRISNLTLGPAVNDGNTATLPIEFDFEDPSGTASSGSLTLTFNLDGTGAGSTTVQPAGVAAGQTSGRIRATVRFTGLRWVSGRTGVFTFVLTNSNGDESNAVSGSFTPP